jgi:hypothetical protein
MLVLSIWIPVFLIVFLLMLGIQAKNECVATRPPTPFHWSIPHLNSAIEWFLVSKCGAALHGFVTPLLILCVFAALFKRHMLPFLKRENGDIESK